MRDYDRYRFGEALNPVKMNLVHYTKIYDGEKVEAFFKLQGLVKFQQRKLKDIQSWILSLNLAVDELEKILAVPPKP